MGRIGKGCDVEDGQESGYHDQGVETPDPDATAATGPGIGGPEAPLTLAAAVGPHRNDPGEGSQPGVTPGEPDVGALAVRARAQHGLGSSLAADVERRQENGRLLTG